MCRSCPEVYKFTPLLIEKETSSKTPLKDGKPIGGTGRLRENRILLINCRFILQGSSAHPGEFQNCFVDYDFHIQHIFIQTNHNFSLLAEKGKYTVHKQYCSQQL